MTHHRSGAIRGTVAVGTLLVVVFLAAGFGVSRLFDHNQRVSSSATDSAVISEQVHVLAVVASQSAVEGADLPALRRTGLEAGIKAKATVDELLRRGLLRSQVEELARRLTEYYAGLAVADQLFAQQDQLAARRMAADTAVMVQPISDLARELRTSLQQEARSTARVVELALRAIVLGVAVGIIAS